MFPYPKLFMGMAITLLAGAAPTLRAAESERLVLRDFRSAGTDFAFLQWKDAVKRGAEGIEIGGPTIKGQGGFGVHARADANGFAEGVPVIRLRLGEHHSAAQINLDMKDADGTQLKFTFDLADAAHDQFTDIFPNNGAALHSAIVIHEPGTTEGFDARQITGWSVLGDWRDAPIHLIIQDISVTTNVPSAVREQHVKAVAEHRQRQERDHRQTEQHRTQLERLLNDGADHPADGPRVARVYPLGDNLIGMEILDRVVERQGQVEYVPQPTDVIRAKGKERWRWENGKLVNSPGHQEVFRLGSDGKEEKLGNLVPRAGKIWPGLRSQGRAIAMETVAMPAAYRISSTTDAAYSQALQPTRVHVKRKPNAYRGQSTLVRVYLELPAPMQVGEEYTVALHAVNTAQPSVTFTHDPRTTRSEAVHVSHIGYRSDDPYKQGKLSLWLGTGGAHDFSRNGQLPSFAVIDQTTGEVVYSGTAELAKAADEPETHIHQRNYAQTPVYTLDFTALKRPGHYRLVVDNVGCSYPFHIAEDRWTEAFRLSMEGVLAHRSGIELGPPTMAYRRPRTMHPDDEGFAVYPIGTTALEGEVDAVQAGAAELVTRGKLPTPMPNAWGGYMDAGDWDRHAGHMDGSYLLLELYELFPERFASMKLNLPPEDASNRLPDLLSESLWNLAMYRRLQEADGGVRGGIESTEHPLNGEASWQESLFVGCFAADPVSSHRFAAKAAKFARLTAKLRPDLAADYRQAAIKAWDWSEANGERILQALKKPGGQAGNANTVRNLAAVELYWLTGDAKFHEVFKATSILATMDRPRQLLREGSALFTYARLPDTLGDAQLKAKAKMFIITMADRGLAFAEGNSYGITSTDSMPPMGWVGYFSVPGNRSLSVPRAFILTGDPKYLAGTVRAANFAAGCNPDNRALTTGLGHDPVRWPLHLDSRVTGQEPPRGITVCGQSDPAERYKFEDWAHTWIYRDTKTPDSYTWPAYEAYADIAVLPSINEYTINAILHNAYTWGILAARPGLTE